MAKGFVFMDTPGYDPVSVTGMVAGGANVVCFTTGRGSACSAPSRRRASSWPPTATMYRRMAEDMDVNCGEHRRRRRSAWTMWAGRSSTLVLAVASGQRTKSEELGFGDEEFTPWQLGAVL